MNWLPFCFYSPKENMCFDLHSMGEPKILCHLQALKSTEMMKKCCPMMWWCHPSSNTDIVFNVRDDHKTYHLPGFSTFIISAPKSPRSIVVKGPARILSKNECAIKLLHCQIKVNLKTCLLYLFIWIKCSPRLVFARYCQSVSQSVRLNDLNMLTSSTMFISTEKAYG